MRGIPIDQNQVERVKSLAGGIAEKVHNSVRRYSTVSIERAVLRLYGVDGVDNDGTPLPNRLVEIWQASGGLSAGISAAFAAAVIETDRSPQETAEAVCRGDIRLASPPAAERDRVRRKEAELTRNALARLDRTARLKEEKAVRYSLPLQPWRYVIVATGNVYEDRVQAEAAVAAGADIIAQIRSTAQSLLDYIPYGPTTEGVGGTFATQANFRIMRAALDDLSARAGRYLRLVNYSSGLCMTEIAVCAALEDLDILLNDSMYGILFRDINMTRTFVDQYASRRICARAGIMINTGEDNYLTTADAVSSAHTVTASQLINEALAKQSGLPESLLGLGHAFEIDPHVENSFLYELAHAQLARQLFPGAPIKYMPPTKHKPTDIFYAHAMDTMFNLASLVTNQGIHLAGMPTEAIHNPLMQDRYHSLGSINYVFHAARSLGSEIHVSPDGVIARRVRQVLDETEAFLSEIDGIGLMNAISRGRFANVQRSPDGGKGRDGVFKKSSEYSNPLLDTLEREGSRHD